MFTKIADYGLIGDCRSCALVSKWGSIDWFCLPDVDSPAVFLSLLDDKKGGYFSLRPVGFYQSSQIYKENTNILKTEFFNHLGRVLLTDFMPISKKDEEAGTIPTYGWKFARRMIAKVGAHRVRAELKLTPNYAQETLLPTMVGNQLIFHLGEAKIVVWGLGESFETKKGTISWEFDLAAGEEKFFALGFFPKSTEEEFSVQKARDFYYQTLNFWLWWVSICRYEGIFKREVIRSVLTLKMLTFAPTGGVVAAPTTSLPEKIGGNLNWDYRYVWLRDASFTMFAFLGLGYLKEAAEFMNWIEEVCLSEQGNVQIMYGLRGESQVPETTLDHLAGYEASKPVRVGNAAYLQKQFDVFGELLSCLNIFVSSGGSLSSEMKNFIVLLVSSCERLWKEKDAGIWEPRDRDDHHTYSKLMCWVGIDRGLVLAKELDLDLDVVRLEKVREEIKEEVLENGFNEALGAFVDTYGSSVVDSSSLNIPLVGFLPADDSRVLSTLDVSMTELTKDWFVFRTSNQSDQLKAGEGAFFLSTFWVIDNLASLGRIKEAKIWLEKIIYYATPLGLYAEMFDPAAKEHLGNYPQAFTHLGLINSVLNLDRAMKFGAEKKAFTKAERLTEILAAMNAHFENVLENIIPSKIRKTFSEKQRRRTAKRSFLGRILKRS